VISLKKGTEESDLNSPVPNLRRQGGAVAKEPVEDVTVDRFPPAGSLGRTGGSSLTC